jgi:uncharacterized OB-fold protein
MAKAPEPEVISDEEVLQRFPGVLVDYDNAAHFRGILERRLLINRCQDCGHWIYPHYPMCSVCWSTNVVPTEVSGKATVRFFTLLHQPAFRAIEGIDYSEAHPDVAFELVEQERLCYSARLVNCRNEDLYIGMPVELTWSEADGVPAPAFQPAPGARPRKGAR